MPAKARKHFSANVRTPPFAELADGFGVFDGRAVGVVLTQMAEAPRFGLRSVRSHPESRAVFRLIFPGFFVFPRQLPFQSHLLFSLVQPIGERPAPEPPLLTLVETSLTIRSDRPLHCTPWLSFLALQGMQSGRVDGMSQNFDPRDARRAQPARGGAARKHLQSWVTRTSSSSASTSARHA